MFPYYLSIGMTYDLYWHGDPDLVKAYRKAEEIRNDRKNQEMWLQGMYIYEALCDVSVVIPRLSKRPVKPEPYSKEPYQLRREDEKQRERREKARMQKAKAKMEAFATRINAKKRKEVKNEDV